MMSFRQDADYCVEINGNLRWGMMHSITEVGDVSATNSIVRGVDEDVAQALTWDSAFNE